MRHVDALSRVEVYALEREQEKCSEVFDNALYINQLKDKKIQELKQKVRNGDITGYEIRDGILYKVNDQKSQLYVPENMEESVIYKYHNGNGHFGRDKVAEMIKRVYWFPELSKKLKEHINSCVVCIYYNPKNKCYDGRLNSIEKPRIPFQMVHVDHVGPLEATRSGNKYIFAICDGFTKYLKLYATKTTNTREVNKYLKSYIQGLPS